jgi:hypothetical protein
MRPFGADDASAVYSHTPVLSLGQAARPSSTLSRIRYRARRVLLYEGRDALADLQSSVASG